MWACVGFSQSAVSRVVTRAAAGSQAFALDESEQKIKEKVEKEHKTEKKRENKKKRGKKKEKKALPRVSRRWFSSPALPLFPEDEVENELIKRHLPPVVSSA